MYQDYSPATDLLADRTIIVTGAGRDIGKSAALEYARHGASIVLVGDDVKQLENTYDLIEQSGAPQPAIYPLNPEAASADNYQQLAAVIEQEFGHLDGILHTPTFLGMMTPIEHYDPSIWQRAVQHNINSPFMLIHACLPLLKRADDASILLSTADVGRQGKAYWGAYGISMSALEGMMQILAAELEDNTPVRVNSIDPGIVRTELRRTAYPAENAESLPAPEEIMPPYLYLMGPDSKGITGQQLSAQD